MGIDHEKESENIPNERKTRKQRDERKTKEKKNELVVIVYNKCEKILQKKHNFRPILIPVWHQIRKLAKTTITSKYVEYGNWAKKNMQNQINFS